MEMLNNKKLVGAIVILLRLCFLTPAFSETSIAEPDESTTQGNIPKSSHQSIYIDDINENAENNYIYNEPINDNVENNYIYSEPTPYDLKTEASSSISPSAQSEDWGMIIAITILCFAVIGLDIMILMGPLAEVLYELKEWAKYSIFTIIIFGFWPLLPFDKDAFIMIFKTGAVLSILAILGYLYKLWGGVL